jgi:hypothetical protein
MKSISKRSLGNILGAYGARKAQRTPAAKPGGQPGTSIVPIPGTVSTPTPNLGGPKYSAAWWDLVRARGLAK